MPASVTIYTTGYCGFCHRAKALLKTKGVAFEEIPVDGRADLRTWLRSITHQTTVPQVFVNGRPLGGYSDLAELDGEDELDALLREDPGPQDLGLLR